MSLNKDKGQPHPSQWLIQLISFLHIQTKFSTKKIWTVHFQTQWHVTSHAETGVLPMWTEIMENYSLYRIVFFLLKGPWKRVVPSVLRLPFPPHLTSLSPPVLFRSLARRPKASFFRWISWSWTWASAPGRTSSFSSHRSRSATWLTPKAPSTNCPRGPCKRSSLKLWWYWKG